MSNVFCLVGGFCFALFLVFKDMVPKDGDYHMTREQYVVEELSNCRIGWKMVYIKD